MPVLIARQIGAQGACFWGTHLQLSSQRGRRSTQAALRRVSTGASHVLGARQALAPEVVDVLRSGSPWSDQAGSASPARARQESALRLQARRVTRQGMRAQNWRVNAALRSPMLIR